MAHFKQLRGLAIYQIPPYPALRLLQVNVIRHLVLCHASLSHPSPLCLTRICRQVTTIADNLFPA
jgi:hypothetical protein